MVVYDFQDTKSVASAGTDPTQTFTASSNTSRGSTLFLGYQLFKQVSFDPAGLEYRVTFIDSKAANFAGVSSTLTF